MKISGNMFGGGRTKRCSPRMKVSADAKLFSRKEPDTGSGVVCGISDLSMNGACIHAEHDLDFDALYELTIALPPHSEFTLPCRVLWKESTKAQKNFGVVFEGAGFESKVKLQRLVLENIHLRKS